MTLAGIMLAIRGLCNRHRVLKKQKWVDSELTMGMSRVNRSKQDFRRGL